MRSRMARPCKAWAPWNASGGSDHHALHRAVGGPHLLQIIELPHLWTENVDDDVAGIDQHPVAMGKAFDASASEAFVLELPDKVVGNGADMPLRAPRGYDHLVADRGLALDVDAYDALGLGIVECVEHDVEQTLRVCAK